MINGNQVSIEPRLYNAVDTLYRVFESPVPPVIEGCPCCIETRGTDELLAVPLRQLTGQALWRYVSGAFLTVGAARDFRYFIPRILELSVIDPGNSNDPEIVLGKLSLANWQSWPLLETNAIEEFIDAWFELAISNDIAMAGNSCVGSESESLLCGVSRAGMSLSRWLERLRRTEAGPILADMRNRYPNEMSPFWDDVPLGFQELSAFLAAV